MYQFILIPKILAQFAKMHFMKIEDRHPKPIYDAKCV